MFAAIPAGPIDCLSLLQPWTTLLTLWRDGKAIGKAIETRSKPTRHRGLLAIHASKGDRDLKAFFYACERQDKSPLVIHALAALEEFYPGRNIEELFPLGKVLAIGNLIRVEHTEMIRDRLRARERAFGNYDDNRYGWMFKDMQQLETPVPALGSLGIWKWDPHYVPAPRVAKPKPVKEPKPAKEVKVSVVPVNNVQQLSLFDQEQPMPIHAEDFDFDGPGSGIDLALMMIPDDSPLATASYEERKAALSPKPQPKNRVVIASLNPVKVGATKAAFIEMYSPSQYFVFESSMGISGVSDQPKSQSETRQGAENRARSVFDSYNDTRYSIGIEGGIEDGPDGMRSFAWVAIYDGDQMSCAQTSVFYLPQEVAQLVREGKELGEADDIVFSRINSKQGEGAIGLLTGNSITRLEYYTQAVIMALIPFKNEKLTWTAPEIVAPAPDPMKANTIAAFTDALKQAQNTENNPAHTIEHQTSLSSLLAAAKLLSSVYPDLRGLTPVQAETLANMSMIDAQAAEIKQLNAKVAALEVDKRVQSQMIDTKNQQVMNLTAALRKVNDRIESLEAQTSEALDAVKMPIAIDGKRVSNKVVDPTDQVIEGYYDQKWERVFEGFSNGEHFIRFETIVPLPQPEAEEDARAAAEAAVPSTLDLLFEGMSAGGNEQPELMPERMHQALFSPPVPPARSIADRLREPGGAEALKQEGNHVAAAIGAAAASQRFAELQGNDDEPLVPEAAGMLIAGN